jgi:p-cumate 2,3-dioxygenase beta subunit
MNVHANVTVTRAEVEDFFFHEAALLDEWRLAEWEKLLADDATYYIPPNDDLEGDYRNTLYIISDDRERIRQRVIRVLDPNCHAEYPKSRTCRLITNVRITGVEGDIVSASANFVVYRYRRHQREFVYVGTYQYKLQKKAESFLIKERRVLLHAHELGQLGSVSFIL